MTRVILFYNFLTLFSSNKVVYISHIFYANSSFPHFRSSHLLKSCLSFSLNSIYFSCLKPPGNYIKVQEPRKVSDKDDYFKTLKLNIPRHDELLQRPFPIFYFIREKLHKITFDTFIYV